MTYRLHVYNVFEEMSIMVSPVYVNSLINFYVKEFFLVSFIISESSIKLWAKVWILALKKVAQISGFIT